MKRSWRKCRTPKAQPAGDWKAIGDLQRYCAQADHGVEDNCRSQQGKAKGKRASHSQPHAANGGVGLAVDVAEIS